MAVATPSAPVGYNGLQFVQAVRDYTNEPTLPPDQTVLNFGNKGLEEVERRVGGIFTVKSFPTVTNQPTLQLSNDIQYIESANFSMANASSQSNGSASPFAQGALVTPMMQLTQAQFMDGAAGFPAVGFGPPQAYFIYRDEGLAPSTPLDAPPAPSLSLVSDTGLFLVWNEGNWNQTYWFANFALQTVEVVVTLLDTQGQTTPSLVSDIVLQSATAVLVQSPAAVGDATSWNVFAGNKGGPYYLQNPAPLALGTPFTIPPPFAISATNPPTVNTTGGQQGGGTLWMQLYPAAQNGQVNAYCRMRPLLWADATDASYTNLDTAIQECVVLFAVMRTLANRSRAAEIPPWRQEFEQMVESVKSSVKSRTFPRSGQVRDTYNLNYPSSPFWLNR